jgi:hypothetical protein
MKIKVPTGLKQRGPTSGKKDNKIKEKQAKRLKGSNSVAVRTQEKR